MTESFETVSYRHERPMRSGKRLIDVCVSATCLIALLPILVIVAAAVCLEDGGPPIYRQVRVGAGGALFRIAKFRSMKVIQDGMRAEITVAGDPRITRVGSIIRRFKLDELPQLWNVLVGEMSLVGPRPETPALLQGYTATQQKSIMSLRPGITDWASLILRNESEMLERAANPKSFYTDVLVPLKYELWECYRHELGVLVDLRILAATLWAVAAPGVRNPWLSPTALAYSDTATRMARGPRARLLTEGYSQTRSVAPARPSLSSRLSAAVRARVSGPFGRKFATLSILTALGQLVFISALPVLSRMYTPADFGAFAIYLSVVNLAGPLLSLKFDSALYAARSREECARTLLLALATVGAISALLFVFMLLLVSLAPGIMGGMGSFMVYLLPAGMALSGGWSVSSAWAVRVEGSAALGVARLLQPSIMTALQLAAGLVAPSGAALLVAHLVSHLVYSSFLLLREVKGSDVAIMRTMTVSKIVALGLQNHRFPLYALPAQLSSLSVSNLPPILLSIFYGASIAGHYGVAYRLVVAPLTIASIPLGAIFIGNLLKDNAPRERAALVRKVFFLNLMLVGAPVVILGALAAPLAPVVLGANWALTGQVVTALSLLGIAQALAAPFSEATSIFAAQGLRLLIESATAIFVVGALVVCALFGAAPLSAIWIMSIGGALFSLAGLRLVVGRIDRPRDALASHV